jgi:hypothetical protein
MSETTRRTKRRYANELYPHNEKDKPRKLAVEVPYLYARALGFEVWGTGWFEADSDERVSRTYHLIDARHKALIVDALLQGLTGDKAWRWAEKRMDEEGSWIWERAVHYGVDPRTIKPYPCGPTRDKHSHLSEPDARGFQLVTYAPGAEEDCDECTEPVIAE